MNIRTCAGCGRQLFPGDLAIEVGRFDVYCLDVDDPQQGCALRVFIGHSLDVEFELEMGAL